ncbi:MAG: sulfur relay protein DsrC [Gammaproteobacteria bacterium]|mgnify:CR=1 FL=1|jgi:predicted metalloendopeptidase|nr:sulfur relay protein DsrC [Gammaproteobacteria bacterium]NBQ33765.1 sulfur relay protein DsrC [Gammaproteobacteria bacterium]
MLLLSEIMIAHTDLESFEDLVAVVKKVSKTSNERFFKMDVKPDYQDTPDNWEDRIEAAFY